MDSFILVIDSGVGGVSILRQLRKKLPYENFIYYADNKDCPLGSKQICELQEIVKRIIYEVSSKYKIKLIVFACNTLSSLIIDYVENNYEYKVIGTEPNIEEALRYKGKILVIATPNTIKYNKKLNFYAKNNKNIILLPLFDFAEIIENGNISIYEYLSKNLKRYKKIKSVVLGCTHYELVKNDIQIFFNKAKIFTSANVVCENVK
jgi:glutamate racemase